MGRRNDDIAALARDFDRLGERISELLSAQQRLFRDISHELRSPLARMQASTSILRQRNQDGCKADNPETSLMVGQLDRMDGEIELVNELIGQILSLCHLDSCRQIDRTPTDLVALLGEVVENANFEAQGKECQVVLTAPARLTLPINSDLIGSAVENIIRNALYYTEPKSQILVTVSVGSAHNAAAIARVDILDHGPGVPEAHLEQLFEPFYRVGESRDRQSGGGGIGLTIAERAVRLHQGRIEACNIAGAGLQVRIQLPLSPVNDPLQSSELS